MTVEKLPNLGLPEMGDVEDPTRPILSYDWTADTAHEAAAHTHPRAHIISPTSGAYWVVTDEGTWLVPEGLAIWIPSMVTHRVYSFSAVAARILFVDRSLTAGLPDKPGTVQLPTFMDAMMSRMIELGNHYVADSAAARLGLVVLDELAAMQFARIPLPISRDPRLARVMDRIAKNPQEIEDIEAMAEHAACSPRTLARLFKRDTGMTYTQWRSNVVISEAIKRLAQGQSVTQVALDLGYSSTSSFSYMFRRNLGVPPRTYLAD
jgi:AraC-like DNA-binding protein